MIDISINEIEIEVSNSDVYLTKEKIDSIENERSDLYKDYLSKQRENIDINTTREKKYNETLYEMNAKINEYNELIKALELEKQRYSGLCVSLQNKIDSLGN
jgi:FlaG/FlaF family flagellin (archaellin)